MVFTNNLCYLCKRRTKDCTPTDEYTCQNYLLDDDQLIQSNKSTDPTPNNDHVNHPSHYTQGGIECIDAIKASMTPEGFQDYCKGNVLKYIWRWRNKGGIEDLKKADVYLFWLIESVEESEKRQSDE